METTTDRRVAPVVPTGVAGLDAVLGGGLPRGRMYLIQGDPGVGKTTLALQFLLEGRRLGEKGLYVTLGDRCVVSGDDTTIGAEREALT